MVEKEHTIARDKARAIKFFVVFISNPPNLILISYVVLILVAHYNLPLSQKAIYDILSISYAKKDSYAVFCKNRSLSARDIELFKKIIRIY